MSLRGSLFNSIEHVFQSKKIELVDPVKAYYFTVESGHEIGLGDGAMAQKNRKLAVLKKADLDTWFWMSADVMKRAAMAKYTQCPAAAEVLRCTGNAQLWHVVPRKQPVRFEHLEEIRRVL